MSSERLMTRRVVLTEHLHMFVSIWNLLFGMYDASGEQKTWLPDAFENSGLLEVAFLFTSDRVVQWFRAAQNTGKEYIYMER